MPVFLTNISNPGVKFMFFKKTTKFDKIFTVDLTLCSKYQIDREDFVNFVAFLENMNFTNINRLLFLFTFLNFQILNCFEQ